ncbi:MAG: hypothetical protein IIA61_03005 [Candidatus Marinimicrobia bacterium]|nr:hypothetical protein [Candidatus Neomarinimicrobiota bacterium]
MSRLKYWNRIFKAYVLGKTSHLSFWHGIPAANEKMKTDELGQYYMPFHYKADYLDYYDDNGIPMLDYQGHVGLQYNPIAIAQWGLGNYNLWCDTKEQERYDNFIKSAEWLVDNLEQNQADLWVWMHHFDWEYRDTLKSPWYSALSQGQGISLLVRAWDTTKNKKYFEAVQRAVFSFYNDVNNGGVVYTDEDGNKWFEEAIVNPPTHILNGFLWATWGIYDLWLVTGDNKVKNLFDLATNTLSLNMQIFDCGYWSLYEQSGTKMKMLASPFYHSLHIVQLQVMNRLTGKDIFIDYANHWTKYLNSNINKYRAVVYKSIFKLFYY